MGYSVKYPHVSRVTTANATLAQAPANSKTFALLWSPRALETLTNGKTQRLQNSKSISGTGIDLFTIYIYSTCRWHGSCRTYPKNANSHVICKVKKAEKCISPVSSVKCLGKKNHMTWDLCIQKDAKHVMSTNSHTVHFTSHMNKDSILVYDYLLAVGIIQNYTSAVRIFQSHMNPFTSLFYLATI